MAPSLAHCTTLVLLSAALLLCLAGSATAQRTPSPPQVAGYTLFASNDGPLDTRPGYDLENGTLCDVFTIEECYLPCDAETMCDGFTVAANETTTCCQLKTMVEQPLAFFDGPAAFGWVYKKTYPQLNNTDTVPAEYLGTWVGDEAFVEGNMTGALCTSLIQQPENDDFGAGRKMLQWVSAADYCEANYLNELDGTFNSTDYSWFQNIQLEEIYNQQVLGWECLPVDECQDDLSDGPLGTLDLSDFHIANKSCSSFWSSDLGRAPAYYYCNKVQTSLIMHNTDPSVQYLVNTITYGPTVAEPGYDGCPAIVTFNETVAIEEPSITGSTRQILQNTVWGQSFNSSIPSLSIMDPCNWSCAPAEWAAECGVGWRPPP